jgi:hypothetical protein
MSIIIHLFEFQLPMWSLNPEFLKRDCGTIPVAEIITGKIEIFSKLSLRHPATRQFCRSTYTITDITIK